MHVLVMYGGPFNAAYGKEAWIDEAPAASTSRQEKGKSTFEITWSMAKAFKKGEHIDMWL